MASGADTTVAGRVWAPTQSVAFRGILVARLMSVFFMHISDCDETFNYWEPLHYLLYGSGFQTWEYSPAYALRSYGYITLHQLPMLLSRGSNKMMVFFLLRVVLAVFCTMSEIYFYRAILAKFGPQVARWTLFFLILSCGMYISSTAFLPSSFAMYLGMLALGAWFEGTYEIAVFAIAASAVVGWPFSAALGIPIAVDLIFSKRVLGYFILWSSFCFLLTAVPLILIDSIYYGKFVFAPLNIVLYNIFGKGGPNLYGVEPWSFYFINSFLNFNVVFPLALLAAPLIEFNVLFDALVHCLGRGSHWFQTLYNTLQVYGVKGQLRSKEYRKTTQSMLIWILVFFTRPHKEERFLFPIYPMFCLCAAVSLTVLPEIAPIVLGFLHFPRPLKRLSRWILTWLPLTVGLIFAILSLSRCYALYRGYHAPIDIYNHLQSKDVESAVKGIRGDVNVCVGKEWHRFPNSFHLPTPKWKLRFVRSEFKGQLPKPYSQFPNATTIIPEGMNDMNREEPSRYASGGSLGRGFHKEVQNNYAGGVFILQFELSKCHILVDLDLPVSSPLEPRYAQDTKTWKIEAKYPFLDPARSHRLLRAFYVPWLSQQHVEYASYLLLLNKKLLTIV